MKHKNKDTPEIVVPKGYDLLDLIDTDDKGYDFGEPIMTEEVNVRFERDNGEKQRLRKAHAAKESTCRYDSQKP